MRRFVYPAAGVAMLALSGCTGFGTFLEHSVSLPGTNVNRPAADSENMRRALGQSAGIAPLSPEPGNVWPGPQGPDPTLSDIEKQQNSDTRPTAPATQNPNGTPRGSPAPVAPLLPRSAGQPNVPPLPLPAPGIGGSRAPGGVVNTPGGQRFDAGGSPGARLLTAPGQAGAIVVPNGNGTSTVISPDGGVQVIPTPR